MTAPIPPSGSQLLGGAVFPDDHTQAGLPSVLPIVSGGKRVATLDLATGMVAWEESLSTGQYYPVSNGDPEDPQPFWLYDANDCPSFMALWMEF